GLPPNSLKDIQPDISLGGPISRDRIWFFGAYRRVQEDQTLNNAPVARERRGNLVYAKVTSQLNANHRISGLFQYDRATAANAVMRSTAIGAPATTGGLSSATPQLVAASAFGDLIT